MEKYTVIGLLWIISILGIGIPFNIWWPDFENSHALIVEGTFAADLAILFFYLQRTESKKVNQIIVRNRALELKWRKHWVGLAISQLTQYLNYYQGFLRYIGNTLPGLMKELETAPAGRRGGIEDDIGGTEDNAGEFESDAKQYYLPDLEKAVAELEKEIDPVLHSDIASFVRDERQTIESDEFGLKTITTTYKELYRFDAAKNGMTQKIEKINHLIKGLTNEPLQE